MFQCIGVIILFEVELGPSLAHGCLVVSDKSLVLGCDNVPGPTCTCADYDLGSVSPKGPGLLSAKWHCETAVWAPRCLWLPCWWFFLGLSVNRKNIVLFFSCFFKKKLFIIDSYQ